jgi:hypothetical protein
MKRNVTISLFGAFMMMNTVLGTVNDTPWQTLEEAKKLCFQGKPLLGVTNDGDVVICNLSITANEPSHP